MKNPFRAATVGLVTLAIALTMGLGACRQNEPGLDPKMPANSPLPTKIDKTEDPPSSPKSTPDASAGPRPPGPAGRSALARE